MSGKDSQRHCLNRIASEALGRISPKLGKPEGQSELWSRELQKYLNENYNAQAKLVIGEFRCDMEYPFHGKRVPHTWVEVKDWLIDITASVLFTDYLVAMTYPKVYVVDKGSPGRDRWEHWERYVKQ